MKDLIENVIRKKKRDRKKDKIKMGGENNWMCVYIYIYISIYHHS